MCDFEEGDLVEYLLHVEAARARAAARDRLRGSAPAGSLPRTLEAETATA